MWSTSEANWCDSGHLLRRDLIRCHLTFEIQMEENQKQNNGLSANCKRPQPICMCGTHLSLHLSLRARFAEKNKVQLTTRRRLWGKIYISMLPSLPWRRRDRLPNPTETLLSRRLGQFLWTHLLVAEPGSEVRRRSSHTVQAPVFKSGRSHLCNPQQSQLVMWWLDITLCKPPGIRRDTHTLFGKNHEASLEAFKGAKRLAGPHYQAVNSVLTFCLGLETVRIQCQKVNPSKSRTVQHSSTSYSLFKPPQGRRWRFPSIQIVVEPRL